MGNSPKEFLIFEDILPQRMDLNVRGPTSNFNFSESTYFIIFITLKWQASSIQVEISHRWYSDF